MVNHNQILSVVTVLGVASLMHTLTAAPMILAASTSVADLQNFTVPVTITNASDVFAFQFDLALDPGILRLLNISEGSFLPQAGTTIFSPGTIDNSAGNAVNIADSLVGNIAGASGNGPLVNLTFQAIHPGSSSLLLTNVILLDSNLNDIPVSTMDARVEVSTSVPEPAGLWLIGAAALFATYRRAKRGMA